MANESEHPLEHADMVATDIERFAGGARDIPKRQQHLRCGEVLAGTPVDGCLLGARPCKILDQGGFTCARFSPYRDDAAMPAICFGKSLCQSMELIVPL